MNLDDAYLALIKNNEVVDVPLHKSAPSIAKHCALSASVSRASVWVTRDDPGILHCVSLYIADTDTYEEEAVLKESDFPAYFTALAAQRVVDARQASIDTRTCELRESYLEVLNVQSLLDATIRQEGKIVGVLCLEMVGEQRDWTKNEQTFVTSVADFISQRIISYELLKSEETYKALFERSSEGIAIFQGNSFSEVNPAMCTIFRCDQTDIIGCSPLDVSPEYQPDGQLSSVKAMFYIEECLKGNPQKFDWIHKRFDDEDFHAEITLIAAHLAGNDTLFALIRDITARKVAEKNAALAQEKLRYRAAHDSLTGLANREQLHTFVNDIINKRGQEQSDNEVALFLLDLNRFKEVNDTLGHATGDKVLIRLSEILNDQVTALGGCLFRLGGDEFVAVFDSNDCTKTFSEIDSTLHQCLRTSVDLDDMKVALGASIGIAIYPENGINSHELLRCADVAMYQAKNKDGLSAWYDAQNDLNNKRRLAMVVELGPGITENQLVLHFQPRIHLRTGDITGCEALVRWNHPRLGMIPPNEFLPLAEMSELIHPLSEWVLKHSLIQIKQLVANGHNVPVAMNLSPRNLTDSYLVDNLKRLLIEEKVEPKLLEIEITESALINHPQRVVENLTKLNHIGIPIAIDDFGTGYSSLSYLKQLPVSTLKIDRSFVMDMLTDAGDSVIVNSTIDLAHNFSLTVVAEGVENQATLDELEKRNCDQAQGFFIGEPMPAEEFNQWLNDYNHNRLSIRNAS